MLVTMEQNVTEYSEITASGSNSMAYIVDSVLFLISVVGMVGNSVAMFILTSSVKIRKSKSYVLIMNQCLLDFTATLFMSIYFPFKYFRQWSNMSGIWDLIMCQVIYSQVCINVPILSSSYNLVALSIERMTSIVWPVFHKVRCTRRRTLIIAVSTWVFGFTISIAFSLPVNGINTVKRKCYYWNNFPSPLHSQVYSFIYNIFLVFFPLLLMLSSYAVMYASISARRIRTGIKLNVARMLVTCVILFLCCHILKVTLVMISRFTSNNLLESTMFIVAIILMQMNSIVNPFIYSLQYMDYKKELKRQFRKITGRMSGKVSVSDTMESTTLSSMTHTN